MSADVTAVNGVRFKFEYGPGGQLITKSSGRFIGETMLWVEYGAVHLITTNFEQSLPAARGDKDLTP